MSFSIRCPNCGTTLNANEKLAGKRLPCPKCKQPLFVQQPAASPAPPSTPQPSKSQFAAASAKTSPASGNSSSKATLIILIVAGAGGFVVLLAVVGLCVWLLLPGEGTQSEPDGGQLAQQNDNTATSPPAPNPPPGPIGPVTQPDPNPQGNEPNNTTPDTDPSDVQVGDPDSLTPLDDESNPLIAELAAVITGMYGEKDTGLHEDQLTERVDERVAEILQSLRTFYPAFPNPAESETKLNAEILRVARTNELERYPITAYLQSRDRSGPLTAQRERLLWELIKASFAIKYAASTNHEVNRLALEEIQPVVFPEFEYPDDSAQAEDEALLRNHSRELMMGMHEFLEIHDGFPGADRKERGGPAGLSWRVHLLPFIGHQALYDQFKIDEPWDSDHNMQMVARMPDVFQVPWVSEPGMTCFHVLTGSHGAFGSEDPPGLTSFRDGMSNTLAFVVAGPDVATPWTQPGGIEVNVDSTIKVLGAPMLRQGFMAAYADASVSFLPANLPPNLFLAVAGKDDGIPFNVTDLTGIADIATSFIWPLGERDQPMRLEERLWELGKAMHRYHDVFKRFPDAGDDSKLSWRVALLPYLGEQDLYDQFHHDEPWDSPHNIALLDSIPNVFPQSSEKPNHSLVHVFVDEGTPFGGETGPDLGDIPDGFGNVIMFVLGTEATAMEWTRPGGLEIPTDSNFREMIGTVEGKGFPLVTFDGRLKAVNSSFLGVDQFNSLIHADDGTDIPENMMVPWEDAN